MVRFNPMITMCPGWSTPNKVDAPAGVGEGAELLRNHKDVADNHVQLRPQQPLQIGALQDLLGGECGRRDLDQLISSDFKQRHRYLVPTVEPRRK